MDGQDDNALSEIVNYSKDTDNHAILYRRLRDPPSMCNQSEFLHLPMICVYTYFVFWRNYREKCNSQEPHKH